MIDNYVLQESHRTLTIYEDGRGDEYKCERGRMMRRMSLLKSAKMISMFEMSVNEL